MATPYQDILSSLPYSLRRRFTSLGKYTREITIRQLDDRLLTRKRKQELLRKHLADIQATVLVISVGRYLQDGIVAAEGAVKIARSFDVDGFTVGTTEFSEDSTDIADWRQVHESLEALMKDAGIEKYAIGRYPWDYVHDILQEILDG